MTSSHFNAWISLLAFFATAACADERSARDHELGAAANSEDGATANSEDEAKLDEPARIPEGFEPVQTACKFQFYAPHGIRSIPVNGIDSCVLQFELDDCKITGGSGAYSPGLAGASRQAEYEGEAVEVDGRAAKLVRFRAPEVEGSVYVTALHIPISDKEGWYISIDLRASCETREGRDRMRDVLLSVDADADW